MNPQQRQKLQATLMQHAQQDGNKLKQQLEQNQNPPEEQILEQARQQIAQDRVLTVIKQWTPEQIAQFTLEQLQEARALINRMLPHARQDRSKLRDQLTLVERAQLEAQWLAWEPEERAKINEQFDHSFPRVSDDIVEPPLQAKTTVLHPQMYSADNVSTPLKYSHRPC